MEYIVCIMCKWKRLIWYKLRLQGHLTDCQQKNISVMLKLVNSTFSYKKELSVNKLPREQLNCLLNIMTVIGSHDVDGQCVQGTCGSYLKYRPLMVEWCTAGKFTETTNTPDQTCGTVLRGLQTIKHKSRTNGVCWVRQRWWHCNWLQIWSYDRETVATEQLKDTKIAKYGAGDIVNYNHHSECRCKSWKSYCVFLRIMLLFMSYHAVDYILNSSATLFDSICNIAVFVQCSCTVWLLCLLSAKDDGNVLTAIEVSSPGWQLVFW